MAYQKNRIYGPSWPKPKWTERDTCVHKLVGGNKSKEEQKNLTRESFILKYGSSSMTLKRNWTFLCFPVLDSYFIPKLLYSYGILVWNLATEIQNLVKASVEILIYLVGDVAHTLLLAQHQGFGAPLFPQRDPFQGAENPC